jgi:hypothetical protein
MGLPTTGSAGPLMGPAGPATVTPLLGPADRGTMVSLMGPADPGTARAGGRLVVEGAELEAAVQDAHEPIAELAHGGLVAGAPGALPVVADAQQDYARGFRAAPLKRGSKDVGQ